MPITNSLPNLSYTRVENEKKKYPVIIVAAGSATRMRGIDKLSYDLCGKPLLVRTIEAFASSERISKIVLVTRADKINEYEAFKEKYNIECDFSVVKGGNSREESVFCGIKALPGFEKVLIHDGARPFVSHEVIDRVADALLSFDSVTCGVKIVNTVKSVNEDNIAVKTLNRDFLYSVQTPQGVLCEGFIEAAARFDLSGFTDDTSVMESIGAKTKIVEGDSFNIKITTPDDIRIAELYFSK